MLLVIPVSRTDARRIPDIAKVFEVNPPGSGHELLVISGKLAGDSARELEGQISQHFSKSSVVVIPTEPNAGWPIEMNYLFQQAATHVSTRLQANQGWMWYELDTVPLEEGWLTELEQEYYRDSNDSVREGRERNVFMGVKEPTIQGKNGEQMSQEEAGYHMAAVGIYPGNILQVVPTIAAIAGGKHPFYQRIQWYVVKSLKETPLIQNNWRTEKYRKTADGIVCESAANWVWDIHFNKPIGKDVLLVHGCKDASLAGIVKKRRVSLTTTDDLLNKQPHEVPTPSEFCRENTPEFPSKSEANLPSVEVLLYNTNNTFPTPQVTERDILENYAAGEVPPAPKPQKPKRKKLTAAERRRKTSEYMRKRRERIKAEMEAARNLQPEQ